MNRVALQLVLVLAVVGLFLPQGVCCMPGASAEAAEAPACCSKHTQSAKPAPCNVPGQRAACCVQMATHLPPAHVALPSDFGASTIQWLGDVDVSIASGTMTAPTWLRLDFRPPIESFQALLSVWRC